VTASPLCFRGGTACASRRALLGMTWKGSIGFVACGTHRNDSKSSSGSDGAHQRRGVDLKPGIKPRR
jgi:hypothetical protein